MTTAMNIFEILTGSNGAFLDIKCDDFVPGWLFTLDYMPWFWAMIGSILVGLSGVLPLLVIPIDQTDNLKQGDSANKLKTLLSFAVGGLLGDVFLHSLPEIWANDAAQNDQDDNSASNVMDRPMMTIAGLLHLKGGHPTTTTGLLILSGLIVFVVAEKSFSVIEKLGERQLSTPENNNVKGYTGTKHIEENKKHITGYLNLLANTIDNFTHGLSLGGAFLVSLRLGLLTTFAILVHEIPHEVGDFAILLKSGFSRWDAAVFQILTAGGGLLGSFAAIMCSGASNSIEAKTSWILPFTAGTFLHIALVTILPDLLKEEDPKESLKQLLALIGGIFVMAIVSTVFE